MEIFIQIEVVIAVECCLSRQLALAVGIVAALIPHRVTALKIVPTAIRDIGNNQLCRSDSVFFVILH